MRYVELPQTNGRKIAVRVDQILAVETTRGGTCNIYTSDLLEDVETSLSYSEVVALLEDLE